MVPTCIRVSGHWGGTSSPPLGRLHCLLQSALCGHASCPGAFLKMSSWKRCSKCLWSTASKVKLCGMWVELYKNTMSHLILLIVAIRQALTQQKAKWKTWQTAFYPQKWGVQKFSLECLRHCVVSPSIWSAFSRFRKEKKKSNFCNIACNDLAKKSNL